jgi:hypothetical protein
VLTDTDTGNRQPATGNRQPATGNRQPATGNRQRTECVGLSNALRIECSPDCWLSPRACRWCWAAQPAGVVDRLSWLAGCWQQSSARSAVVVEEQWMAPRGSTMLGMGRTVRGDATLVEIEHLQIVERNGQAVYHAEPSGQPPADFTAGSVSDTLVVFENSKHDFPQRVVYRKRGADSLLARIEGTMNGKARGVDFPYARTRCANQP